MINKNHFIKLFIILKANECFIKETNKWDEKSRDEESKKLEILSVS